MSFADRMLADAAAKADFCADSPQGWRAILSRFRKASPLASPAWDSLLWPAEEMLARARAAGCGPLNWTRPKGVDAIDWAAAILLAARMAFAEQTERDVGIAWRLACALADESENRAVPGAPALVGCGFYVWGDPAHWMDWPDPSANWARKDSPWIRALTLGEAPFEPREKGLSADRPFGDPSPKSALPRFKGMEAHLRFSKKHAWIPDVFGRILATPQHPAHHPRCLHREAWRQNFHSWVELSGQEDRARHGGQLSAEWRSAFLELMQKFCGGRAAAAQDLFLSRFGDAEAQREAVARARGEWMGRGPQEGAVAQFLGDVARRLLVAPPRAFAGDSFDKQWLNFFERELMLASVGQAREAAGILAPDLEMASASAPAAPRKARRI